ncbi:MAG: DNA polymerase, partial [Candidatus Thorarchaeota archaeon]
MVLQNPTWQQIDNLILPELHALDLETTGLDVLDPEIKVLGIGLANSKHAFYINMMNIDPDVKEKLYSKLETINLVAHNTFFDAAFMQRDTGKWLDWQGCSLVLFKMLAAEGWNGQRWGLDVAINDLLGWPVNNKDTLDELLKKHKLPKSRMGELATLEPKTFAEYCANDADACFQLWHYLIEVCQSRFPSVQVWHQQEFLTSIRLLIEQQFAGIKIQTHRLDSYLSKLGGTIVKTVWDFLEHPQVAPHIEEYNRNIIEAHKESEPPKMTKTGKVSVRWQKWEDKLATLEEDNHFNINSKQQLAWLFYDRIHQHEIRGKQLVVFTEDGPVETDLTESGSRPVHKKLLPQLGAAGRMLADYNKLIKEEGYVKACKEKLRDGVIHPQFRPHGTVTGRLGGSGGLNLQQLPKTEGYLKCWRARPQHKIVQLDFSALEPVVLANGSQDPTLMRLYGPDAAPNDVYLYNAAHISAFKDKITRHYDPYAPTPEGIAAAKKHCKPERSANKVVHLAKQYGAGAFRIWHILRENKFPMELDDVKVVCEEWDELYKGTKEFEHKLINQWHQNKGYIYNLVERPVAVHEDKMKDMLNRYCQSAGHDIL